MTFFEAAESDIIIGAFILLLQLSSLWQKMRQIADLAIE